jgi:hypothetical protein
MGVKVKERSAVPEHQALLAFAVRSGKDKSRHAKVTNLIKHFLQKKLMSNRSTGFSQ